VALFQTLIREFGNSRIYGLEFQSMLFVRC